MTRNHLGYTVRIVRLLSPAYPCGHLRSPENTYTFAIKSSYGNPCKARRCKQCHKARAAQWWEGRGRG